MKPITRKKLIEVALPLEAINAASAREKSIRHGHPSTLHLWWARRPLAAARAVLFAQLVDDPSARPELFPTDEAQSQERQRLFGIIEDLVKWGEHHQRAGHGSGKREEIRQKLAADLRGQQGTIPGRRSCSTRTSSPPSTTPSPEAAPYP